MTDAIHPLEFMENETSNLVRIIDPQIGDLGYGVDLSCTTELDPAGRLTFPDTPEGIAEWVIRLLDTEKGTLADDPGWGTGVRSMLSAPVDASRLNEIAGTVKAEAEEYELIEEVTVTATFAGETLTLEIEITPEPISLAPFTITASATTTDVILEAFNGNTSV